MSANKGYGIWTPGGTGPAATKPWALLGINKETARALATLEVHPVSVPL